MWFSLYKRELLSFFNSVSAYFIAFVYIILSMLISFYLGLYYVIDNPSMHSFFVFQPQIFAVIIPAITMRIWSDEYKSGTIEVLMTFPIKTSTLITTKFFACLSFAIILLAMSLPLLVTTMMIIELDYMNILSSYFGELLMIAMFVAIGCVISALSSIPIVAYLLTVLVLWLIVGFNFDSVVHLISASIDNMPFYFDRALNFSTHYQNFIDGQIGIDGIVYFLSAIFLLQIFNLAIIESKRRK